MTDEELIQAREKAWIDLTDFEYLEYYPRWYKKSSRWINPWEDIEELLAAQKNRKRLFYAWLEINFQCFDRGLPSMKWELFARWNEITTPDGRRYVR